MNCTLEPVIQCLLSGCLCLESLISVLLTFSHLLDRLHHSFRYLSHAFDPFLHLALFSVFLGFGIQLLQRLLDQLLRRRVQTSFKIVSDYSK